MSTDLFAAFGSPGDQQTNGQKPGDTSAPVLGSPQTNADPWQFNEPNATEEDDDDFGDFEDAAPPNVQEPPTTLKQKLNPASVGESGSLSKHEAASRSMPSKAPTSQNPKTTKPPDDGVGHHPFANHMDMLFDAGDDEYDAGADEMGDISSNPEAAAAYSKRIIAEQEAARARQAEAPPARKTSIRLPSNAAKAHKATAKPVVVSQLQPNQSTQRAPNKLRKKSGYVPARDVNVLFDAENVSDRTASDVDDWGDFETTSSGKVQAMPKQAPPPSMDLLSLDDIPATIRDTTDLPTPRAIDTSEIIDDEPWADFEESTLPVSNDVASPTTDPIPWSGFMLQSVSAIGARMDRPSHLNQIPPTNIPPPLVLLSVFPSYFSTTRDLVFEPLSKLDSEQRTQILSSPSARDFLAGYVGLTVILGHIIAGRKSRWKRDQYLAQGMRIGPSGGRAGMKLTGLDRTEVVKEDRESVDVLRLWKAQVGKLRSTISAANGAGSGEAKLSSVPDLAEQMPVKVLKGAEGGLTAPHACALCGLKREERVVKVDTEIEDSFGEWWIEGVSMHRLCWDFWAGNRETLKSR